MKNFLLTCAAFLVVLGARAATNPAESRLSRPLSIAESLDIALQQNSSILKSKADLKASHGIEVQTRAIAWPRVNVTAGYSANEDSATDRFRPRGSVSNAFLNQTFEFANDRWTTDARIVQSIYEGGRINSAMRSAKLTREQALLNHQTVIEDVLRDVRVAYYDVLLGEQLIAVQEASVRLLEEELSETRKRYEAGVVPQFNVLRAEVELANARPRLIRARNTYRIGKDTLAMLLGESVSRDVEEMRLQLTDKLDAHAIDFKLSDALARAFENRSELGAVRKGVALREQQVVDARAGYKPSIEVFAGYTAKSSEFSRSLSDELHGWEAGAQARWSIFDGFLTQGRIEQAQALRERASEDVTDITRHIELEVRTAWSSFVEAREVLESQKKVQEQAEESLRLANARAGAGTATQLDVLNAQTALTEARSTQAQALRDYVVARARLERAIGQPVSSELKKSP